MNLAADAVKLLCNRVCNGTANSAAHNCNLFESLCMGSSAERSRKILKAVALIHMIELLCCSADDLEYNGNSTLFPVIIGNCKGDPFAVFICSENNELTGLCLCGNSRCFNVHKSNRRIQRLFSDNFIHCTLSFRVKYKSNTAENLHLSDISAYIFIISHHMPFLKYKISIPIYNFTYQSSLPNDFL